MSRAKRNVDPALLLSEIVKSDFDLSKFRQVDEQDILQPKNFLEWIVGRDFCNATILPWQLEQGMKLFSDYCPSCSHPDYLDSLFAETLAELQDNIVFLEHGICPKCRKNRLELFSLGGEEPSVKNESVACTGQRAGKSKAIALYTSYQLNRWIALPDPLQHYGLPAMEVVLGTFSALSAEQAEENLWIPFRGLYDQAPWFIKYNEFLREHEKRLSIPLADIKETYIFYPHKRFMTSFTGSDDRKKRGRTRLWGVIDEIAFLNSEANSGAKKKVMDADKNYAALNNSLSTIRQKGMRLLQQGHYNTLLAYMHNASSPYNAMDKIMRLVKGASSSPMTQVVHKATWELNPDYTQESTRQQNSGLSQIEFERDFGAIPPFSDAPYIGEARVMERLCSEKVKKIISATPSIYQDSMGDKYLYLEAKALMPDKIIPRLLALDNGHKQNAFAATLFHYDITTKKIVLDFGISLYPQPDEGLTVHFPTMFDKFVIPILRHFNIKNVFYDRWQSLDQIQRLRDMKIDAQAHSLAFDKDFLPFKQQIISGNITLPPIEISVEDIKEAPNPLALTAVNPISNLIWQTLTVRQAGKKVLKPLEGDDDLFRAFVLGGSRFLDEQLKKTYANYTIDGSMNYLQQSVGALGSFVRYSGGNVGAGNPVNGGPSGGTPGQDNRAANYMSVRTSNRRR
jgi:hypothetical protein